MRILTKSWEKINPIDIRSYLSSGGYGALKKVIKNVSPEKIIELVKNSRLRGRGGAGFPTGDKWELAAGTKSKERFFICNLDESETGVYKDRTIAEKNPQQIIEGILIAAYAIGAKKAFLYINGHYEKQAQIMNIALEQAGELNLVGKEILGTAVEIEIEIIRSSGAYICGEETALINSIEGVRGEPSLKPPYPPIAGLWGKPTVVNNAETVANIPFIVNMGASVFSSIGSKASPGTKLFILEGSVKKRGVMEAPLGTTINELIFNSLYGGGMEKGKEIWFVQLGGASGNLVIPPDFAKPLGYCEGEFQPGCGSLLVADTQMDIKDLLFSWADFFHRESCGKCVPCREGTFRLWEYAKRLRNGRLAPADKEKIEEILWLLKNASFCPLGSFAANGWSDAMKMFDKEIFN